MSTFEDKGSPAYTPPAAGPGSYQQQGQPQAPQGYAQQPQGYAQPPPQGYAQQPMAQGYAPQPQASQLTFQRLQTQLSAAQVGENFRGQLFAQCAQGMHQPTTKYGVFGIITAVVCFPCGLIALFIDVERKCDRCGIKL